MSGTDFLKELPCCEEARTHPELIAHAKSKLPDEDTLFALADLYKIFGDSTRLRILYVLFDTELCVCDIAELLGMTVSAISHQLRVLKKSRLVKYRKSGKSVLYSLADDHVHTILGEGMEHVNE
ncbi:MAG: helix-turn-helix transcriptional regulator [Clostridia bacterium]|nr:helix-turn-helix transcriptional regulator [Clostridia bacterium]